MDIKDYLNLYIGCEVWYKDKLWDLVGVKQPYKTSNEMFVDVELRPDGKGYRNIAYISESFTDLSLIKLILRPLSDMTDEEMKECGNLIYDFSDEDSDLNLNEWNYIEFKSLITPEQFLWLLSKHFDLFGLIEAGLAIDKTKHNVKA